MSTAEQVEHGYNLEADRRLIRELCDRRGWELVEIYDDGGRQGDDPDAPFLKMLLDSHVDLEATVQRIEAWRQSDLEAARGQLVSAEREIAAADARLARFQRGWQDGVRDDEDYREQKAGCRRNGRPRKMR